MPTNQHVRERLAGVLGQLNSAHSGGRSMSNASKGTEREQFVRLFLQNVLPPAYRFGTGDVTDSLGAISGQVDVVVEHSSIPSFPLVGGEHSRLYLAEGVGAVIEVKSDLPAQWREAVATGKKLGALSRWQGPIPFFIVGYEGPQKLDALWERIDAAIAAGVPVRGALSLKPAWYAGFSTQLMQRPSRPSELPRVPDLPGLPVATEIRVSAQGELALLALISELHARVGSLLWDPNALLRYLNIVPFEDRPSSAR